MTNHKYNAIATELVRLIKAIHDNEKITAIKAVRVITGLGLKESKDLVEANWITHGSFDHGK